VDTAVAFSSDRGSSGLGCYLSYAYTGRPLSGRFSIRAHSREYANLSLATDADKAKLEGLAGLGISLGLVGSISATYSFSKRYLEDDRDRVSLHYSRRLFRKVSLTASLSRSRDEDTANELLVGLSMPLGKESFGSVGYQTQDGAYAATADLRRNLPRGPGLGYALRAERRENGNEESETQGSATLDYNAVHGVYTAGYRRVAGQNHYDLRLSGGLVYVDGSVFASRPVTDSFALVRVGDLEGVRVYSSNQEVGETNKRGQILVPSLISYLDNKISLEPEDVPVDYGISELEKYVAPPYRGGGVVTFHLTKLQGFMGHLYLVEKGEKKPAEYAGLDMTVNGEKREGIVGKKGEFYFENVPPGRFPARVFLGKKECQFTLTVPKSDKVMVDLGEVVCEMD
jgi:outer membrane usher protein